MAARRRSQADELAARIDIRLEEVFDEWLEISGLQTDSLKFGDAESFLSTLPASDYCNRRVARWIALRSRHCPEVPMNLGIRRKWNELEFTIESNQTLVEEQTLEARRDYLAANVKRQMGKWLD